MNSSNVKVIPKKKKSSTEPSGECTITGKTVDDWLDPCIICYGVIKTDKLKTELCKEHEHSFHTHCHLRWFTKTDSCPLCTRIKLKEGLRSIIKCPLCSEECRRDSWIEHCSEKHKVIRCTKCKEILLFHNRKIHSKTQCKDPSLVLVGCPALYCTVKVTTAIFEKGMKDPSELMRNHDCRELYECSGCGVCFLETNKYQEHLKKQESTAEHLSKGLATGAGRKRKRAAVEESEKLNKKIRILTKKGVFKKLHESPNTMSRKRLMQIIDENKDLIK